MRRRANSDDNPYWKVCKQYYRWWFLFLLSIVASPLLLVYGFVGDDNSIYYFLGSAFFAVSSVDYLWKGTRKK